MWVRTNSEEDAVEDFASSIIYSSTAVERHRQTFEALHRGAVPTRHAATERLEVLRNASLRAMGRERAVLETFGDGTVFAFPRRLLKVFTDTRAAVWRRLQSLLAPARGAGKVGSAAGANLEQVGVAAATARGTIMTVEAAACEVVADSRFQTVALGAVGGAAALGVGGAATGLTTGGALGAAAGLVPALFTFGLSIPIGAAIGGSAGLVLGAVLGTTAGAIGGGAAGYGAYAKRHELQAVAWKAVAKVTGCANFAPDGRVASACYGGHSPGTPHCTGGTSDCSD